jgi:protoporphyrin/coproporphyrin ferrochelatase
MSRTAVLLLAHGTPQSLDQIPEYLSNVTGGRPLPQSVIDEITHRYSLIGHSPLTEITLAQAAALSHALHLPVYAAMRNWHPYIADVVAQMRADGITNTVVICLAPQNSRTSVGLYKRAVTTAAGDAIRIRFIEGWATHPLLIAAFAEKLRDALAPLQSRDQNLAVLFTAHSVPCRTVWSMSSIPLENAAPTRPGPPPAPPTPQIPDTYPQEAKQTAALVAAALAPHLSRDNWFFAFQSQGVSGGPWLGPSVESTMRALRDAGRTNLLIQPIGFLCDHVEILYDIDIAFRALGDEISLAVHRTQSLNTSPLLIAALADLATNALAGLDATHPLAAQLTP